MAGRTKIGALPNFEDYKSLKLYLRKQYLTTYSSFRRMRTIINQAGTASEVELSEKGGETIAFASADADLSIWAENNHADGLELAWSIEYVDATGTIYTKTGVLNDTDSTTAVEVTGDTDFYRLRKLTVITTANTGYVAIGTSNKATLYGIVEQGLAETIHTRYYCPVSTDAWIARVCASQAIATNLDCYLKVTFTPYGSTTAISIPFPIPNNGSFEKDCLLRLAPLTEATFVIKGNLADITADIQIVEAVQVS